MATPPQREQQRYAAQRRSTPLGEDRFERLYWALQVTTPPFPVVMATRHVAMNAIMKLSCTTECQGCEWKEEEQEMKSGRLSVQERS